MFDFTKVGEQVAAFEARLAALESGINQVLSLIMNVGGMVQQIHSKTVAASPAQAAQPDPLGQVGAVVNTVAQVASEIGAVAAALAPAAVSEPAQAAPAAATHG